MQCTGLDHVGFAVSNLDRSVEWYTEFLDEPPDLRKVWDVEYVSRIVGYPRVTMDCAFWTLQEGVLLELIEYLEPAPGVVDMETYNAGNGHLCLKVADLRHEYERLRGKVEFRSPDPIEIPWGPYQGGLVCYLRDPDGISIELMQVRPGGPVLE